MTRINYIIIIIIIITTISIIILHVYIPIGPRRRCIVFRAPDFPSGGPGFKSRSDHLDLFHGSSVFKSKTTLCKQDEFLTNVMFCLCIYLTDL